MMNGKSRSVGKMLTVTAGVNAPPCLKPSARAQRKEDGPEAAAARAARKKKFVALFSGLTRRPAAE